MTGLRGGCWLAGLSCHHDRSAVTSSPTRETVQHVWGIHSEIVGLYVGHSSGLGCRDCPFSEPVEVGPILLLWRLRLLACHFAGRVSTLGNPTQNNGPPCTRRTGRWGIPKGSRRVSHHRRQVPGLWSPWGHFPGKAQTVLVSFSFTEAFSFNEDILVKLL